MNTLESGTGYQTPKARASVIEKFKWPYEKWMQNWPLEVSNHIDLAFCMQEYPKLVDEDEKFLVMQGILYALDECLGNVFEVYSQPISMLLKTDFDLHKHTIYYWTLYRTGNEDGFTITPLLRDIWNSQLK